MISPPVGFKELGARKIILGLALFCFIGAAYLLRDRLSTDVLANWIQSLGAWAPLVYVVIYLIAPSLFIPGAPITIAGGALFGPLWGTFYSLLGATGGSALAFLVGRYLAGDWAEQRARGIIKRLKEGVESEGWRFVAFTRLVPLFPFNVLNYAFGLTRIKFSHYVAASFLCMIPGAVAYTYIGYAGKEAVLGGEWPLLKVSTALGLIVLVSMVPRFMPLLKRPGESRS